MKLIIVIDQIAPLLQKDLPKKSKPNGITLFSLNLYQDASLSNNTLQRLRRHLRDGDIIEIAFSKEEMERYHQGYEDSDQHRRLTIQDYVAVEYAREHGWQLLADKGCLSRYAHDRGVEVVSLKELECRCEQRQRLVSSRKLSLSGYFDKPQAEDDKKLKTKQQFEDDEVPV